MYRSFVPVAVSALLLGACSPSVPEVPESQQAGYMRILGDLRWDQLTSKKEWKNRFPGCLREVSLWYFLRSNGNAANNCSLSVGGIRLKPHIIEFGRNTGTESKTMTTEVHFNFFEDSQSRALKSTIAQKYASTTSGYCSKFTCWDLDGVNRAGRIIARPTPYTVSILDNVKVDKSDI